MVPGEDTISKEAVVFKVEWEGTALTRNEIAAYNALQGIDGIPKFHRAVKLLRHGILILELLGSDLDAFMRSSGGSLPVPIVYTLGRQLVSTAAPLRTWTVLTGCRFGPLNKCTAGVSSTETLNRITSCFPGLAN